MMLNLRIDSYIFVIGGSTKIHFSVSDKILWLQCNDYYEGLPEKVFLAFKFVHEDIRFNVFDYFVKLDEDMKILKKPDFELSDYNGHLNNQFHGNRSWHIGKCSPNCAYNSKEYTGDYVPWCDGGRGYILSRKAISQMQINELKLDDEIYEDLFIAKMLRQRQIFPVHLDQLSQYLDSVQNS